MELPPAAITSPKAVLVTVSHESAEAKTSSPKQESSLVLRLESDDESPQNTPNVSVIVPHDVDKKGKQNCIEQTMRTRMYYGTVISNDYCLLCLYNTALFLIYTP